MDGNKDYPEFVANVEAFFRLRSTGKFKGLEDHQVLIADRNLKGSFPTRSEAERDANAKMCRYPFMDVPDDSKVPKIIIRTCDALDLHRKI